MIHEGWKYSLEGDHSYSLLKPLVIHSVYVQYKCVRTIHGDGGDDKTHFNLNLQIYCHGSLI